SLPGHSEGGGWPGWFTRVTVSGTAPEKYGSPVVYVRIPGVARNWLIAASLPSTDTDVPVALTDSSCGTAAELSVSVPNGTESVSVCRSPGSSSGSVATNLPPRSSVPPSGPRTGGSETLPPTKNRNCVCPKPASLKSLAVELSEYVASSSSVANT